MRLLPLALLLAAPAFAAPLPEPLSCLLLPARDSAVGSDVVGIVAEVPVTRAQKVAQGAVLVRLDDRLAQGELARAKVVRDNAEARLARGEALKGSGISAEDLGTLRAEAALAAAEVTKAELQVSRSQVLAPFAGTVAEVNTEQGQLTGPEPLVRLLDLSGLKAELVLPAEGWGLVAPGDEIALTADVTGAEIRAVITSIDQQISAESLSFVVTAAFANPDGKIPAGSGCKLAR